MTLRQLVTATAFLVLALSPVFAWEAYRPTCPPGLTLQHRNDPTGLFVHPIDRGPFTCAPQPRVNFAPGLPGLERINSMILDKTAPDADREEAFYHLALRGKSAPPVLLALSRPNVLERKWELALVSAMAGVMDRRMVAPLVYYSRYGTAADVRAEALEGLTRNLLNPEMYVATKQTDIQSYSSLVCGTLTTDTGAISYGNGILPGDERRFLGLAGKMVADPDLMVRVRALQLQSTLAEVLVDQRKLLDAGYAIPWAQDVADKPGVNSATGILAP